MQKIISRYKKKYIFRQVCADHSIELRFDQYKEGMSEKYVICGQFLLQLKVEDTI